MTYQHIRDLREDADLTQGQIAGMIPCSQQAYSLYERGDRDIPTGVLIRLAEIHRTTVDYLLGLTDCRRSPPAWRESKVKKDVLPAGRAGKTSFFIGKTGFAGRYLIIAKRYLTCRRQISLPRRGNFTFHSFRRNEFHRPTGPYRSFARSLPLLAMTFLYQ